MSKPAARYLQVSDQQAVQNGLYGLAIPERQLSGVVILPPQDVFETLRQVKQPVTATVLDPWYNKGVGGVMPNYHEWLYDVVDATSRISEHVFLWGFPEIVYKVLDHLPKGFALPAWLTWYYKNCPSVIRGWRSAQLACPHIARHKAKIYPEHFLNEAQLAKQEEGKLRYLPGPPSVIETSLLVGFVGRNEQTGHPAQKPIKSIEPLILMSTGEGDLVLDPMCGSGTTGVVCHQFGRRAILCDASEDYVRLAEKRLGIARHSLPAVPELPTVCDRPRVALRGSGFKSQSQEPPLQR
jgi:site-specific DNA-methyltransferase (adenine-specific)